ncbi:hypothetical protein HMPREF9193_01171 [Treponema lecithinolyticum ATCC 700332]|uniref:Ketopantoate reductase N-terminal domain-containing protein n=1 Tax=Treponema lecithinolyticum ATCC 700332 TaxID=1321815 RepID=A0ABN0NYX3_TRELE|nr:hypothetical protein HMPREF9193_01171 [Treponema lecithinolyticum ATCC 700332]
MESLIQMKLLIYGTGVIGGLYAAAFAKASYDMMVYASISTCTESWLKANSDIGTPISNSIQYFIKKSSSNN